jgi:hypothetical protein
MAMSGRSSHDVRSEEVGVYPATLEVLGHFKGKETKCRYFGF